MNLIGNLSLMGGLDEVNWEVRFWVRTVWMLWSWRWDGGNFLFLSYFSLAQSTVFSIVGEVGRKAT